MKLPRSQSAVAALIVASLTLLGLGLIVAGALTRSWQMALPGVFTVIGSLATALNPPQAKSEPPSTNPQP